MIFLHCPLAWINNIGVAPFVKSHFAPFTGEALLSKAPYEVSTGSTEYRFIKSLWYKLVTVDWKELFRTFTSFHFKNLKNLKNQRSIWLHWLLQCPFPMMYGEPSNWLFGKIWDF